ncbi:MAG: cyclopropane-fatty-acyl-phospholipid synthase family protein [Coriobacteriia bacterium]|nr:cyclopropane-fatty-acyl-phospholipid synthase family protein [Coriobacteriia bacterium]
MSSSPAEQLLFTALRHGLGAGELTIVGRDGRERVIRGRLPGPAATVVLRSPVAARRTLSGGGLGLAEGYLDGVWDTPDLQSVLDLGVANMPPHKPTRPSLKTRATRAWHALRDNDVAGARKNIEYHYDLGNDFYRLWLDESMAYSSALFCEPGAEDLSSAQVRKWDRLLDQLQPGSRDHLLEIGCGWGGFAIHAAREAGCRVTGVTISAEQHDWAVAAVERAGVENLVEIRMQDYREITGQFTGIASIEMFEAVGERWWPTFFGRVRDLLAPNGAAAIQGITIEDARFEDYRDHPDFIQRYIFPGGMLPSPERFRVAAEAQGLRMCEPHFFGASYAATLSEWAQRFEAAAPGVRALGFDERFMRMWRYYLAYCQAGFKAGTIDVMQVRLER